MKEDESINGAKDFLLLEYESLNAMHHEAKAVGDTRLNFFLTFVAVVSTATITVQSFLSEGLRAWLIAGIAVILITVGLITFRKMLQRREQIVKYRRRLNRIRAWFARYYPHVISGLPYDTDRNIQMDWGRKDRFGSTAFSIAFINTAIFTISVLAVCLLSFGVNASVWIIPLSVISASLSWVFHIAWKIHWMKKAELRDKDNFKYLEEMSSKAPKSVAQGDRMDYRVD